VGGEKPGGFRDRFHGRSLLHQTTKLSGHAPREQTPGISIPRRAGRVCCAE
jgi:hypothetical protein